MAQIIQEPTRLENKKSFAKPVLFLAEAIRKLYHSNCSKFPIHEIPANNAPLKGPEAEIIKHIVKCYTADQSQQTQQAEGLVLRELWIMQRYLKSYKYI